MDQSQGPQRRYRIIPAGPLDFLPALELLFQNAPAEDAYSRIAKALQLLRGRGPEAPCLLLAEQDNDITGVILVQALVGGTGIVWPPQVAPDVDKARNLEDALVRQ